MPSPSIHPGAPRDTVQVRLPDGRIFEAAPGTPLRDVLDVARGSHHPAVAALVDGRLVELTVPLRHDEAVTPIWLTDAEGARIYRRSLVLLLVTAVAELYPDARVTIDHVAASTGAFFCRVHGREPFTQRDLDTITWRMSEIVAADAPIVRTKVPLAEAVALFRERGEADTARLLAHRTKPTLHLYSFRDRMEYIQGYLVPSSGVLQWFALHAYPPGFMLQYPHQARPNVLDPIAPYPKLFAVFEEHRDWLGRLEVGGAGALDDAIAGERIAEISLVGEALHEARIASIAAEIAQNRDRIRVVLIAGPSSSGKTTFSKRLAVQLLANGVRPFPIALDDYFLARDRTPRDEKGEYDYESIHALDLELLNEHLVGLTSGRVVDLPRYNFVTGKRDPGPSVQLERDNVLVMEGIHGLNPKLVPSLSRDTVYKVYVSALTQLNLDGHNRVSTTDTRLIRRIVRDAATRGYDATATLQRWDAVTSGEKKNIFPFQEESDAIFNSALAHEIAVLRPLAEPLLLQVRPDSKQWLEANRLLSFLKWFRKVSPDVVPTNSILREFVGGSVLESFNFTPFGR